MGKQRYFKELSDMIEYAKNEIKYKGTFEFQYGSIGEEEYITINQINLIVKINNDSFKFNNIKFSLDLIIPCC